MIFLAVALAAVSDCNAAARMSGVEYRQCLGRIDKLADAEMMRQWRITWVAVRNEDRNNRLEKANKPALTQSLLQSQRAWLRYRDAECNMVSDQAAGGTAYGELGSECSITLTRQRTGILKQRVAGLVRYLR